MVYASDQVALLLVAVAISFFLGVCVGAVGSFIVGFMSRKAGDKGLYPWDGSSFKPTEELPFYAPTDEDMVSSEKQRHERTRDHVEGLGAV